MIKNKKYLFILVIFIIVLLNNKSYANSTTQKIIFGDKIVSVRTIPVIYNNQKIYTSFPSFIHKDKTYVPIRSISDIFGAKVEWSKDDLSTTITYGDKFLKLFQNQNFASVNGEIITFENSYKPSIARLQGYDYGHTMLPLDFIANFFECIVGYNEASKIPYINSNGFNNNLVYNDAIKIETVAIKLDHIFLENANMKDLQILTLENPDRIVIDFPNSILLGRNKFDLNSEFLYINNIRGSQFSTDKNNLKNNVVRLVLDLKTKSDLFYLDIKQVGNDLLIYPKIK